MKLRPARMLWLLAIVVCLALPQAGAQRHICLGNDINPCDAPPSAGILNETGLPTETTIVLEEDEDYLVGTVPLPPGVSSERELFGSYCGDACGNNRCDDELSDCMLAIQLDCGIELGIPFCDECATCPQDCPRTHCPPTTVTSSLPMDSTSTSTMPEGVSSTLTTTSSLAYRPYLPPNYSESDWRRRLAAENAKSGWESLLEAFGIREPDPLPGEEPTPESGSNTMTYLFVVVGLVIAVYGIAVYLRRI